MSNRELVIDLLSKMPEDAPLEQIANKILLVAGIDEARAEARRGEGMTIEEVKKLFEKWDTESS